MTQIYPIDTLTQAQRSTVAQALQAGAVAVFPTDTVYGIGANAFDQEALERIYALKNRPAQAALQLLIGTTEQARELVQWDERAARLAAAFWPGALTLILRPSLQGLPLRRGFAGLGLRVPAHAGLRRLLEDLPGPLASTSANLHGQPVLTQEADVRKFFDGKVDILLTGGDLSAVASTVLDITAEPKLLREGALSRAQLEDVLQAQIK